MGFASKVVNHIIVKKTHELLRSLACEAGDSLKLGASAPGSLRITKRARDNGRQLLVSRVFRPLPRAPTSNDGLPGADAPGSTLTPASQAKTHLPPIHYVAIPFCYF